MHSILKCLIGKHLWGEIRRNPGMDKGIPIHSLVDSAFRHLAKYTEGQDDEPHLRAAAWNLLWALQMEHTHPELQDLPAWRKEATHE